MVEADFKNTAILGVGLIGGSLAMGLKRCGLSERVVGYGRTVKNLETARSLGLIDAYSLDPGQVVEGADLVVLATPVGAFPFLIEQIKGHLKAGAVVIDVGSVKGEVIRDVESKLPEGVFFVSTHPVAGSEKSGVEAADPGLFRDGLCIITPTEKTSGRVMRRVADLWEKLGMRISLMSPEEHDRVMAGVSHFPHLLAYLLVDTVAGDEPEVLLFSGGGFRDTTRVAESSPGMWSEIMMINKANLLDLIDRFRRELDEVEECLRYAEQDRLQNLFKKAVDLRMRLER